MATTQPNAGRTRSAATRLREHEVTPGHPNDKCPLCGIWRENAGWMEITCGTHFRKPGCFIAPEKEAS